MGVTFYSFCTKKPIALSYYATKFEIVPENHNLEYKSHCIVSLCTFIYKYNWHNHAYLYTTYKNDAFNNFKYCITYTKKF